MKAKVFIPVFFSVVSVVVVAGAGIFQYIKNQQDTVPLSVERKSIRRNPRSQIATYRNTTRSSNLQSRRSTTQNSNNLQPPSLNTARVNALFNYTIPDNKKLTLNDYGADGTDTDSFYACIGNLIPEISSTRPAGRAQTTRGAIVNYIYNEDPNNPNKYYTMYQNAKTSGYLGDAFGPNIINTENFDLYRNDILANHPHADQITICATANRYSVNIIIFTKQNISLNSLQQLTWKQMKILIAQNQLTVRFYNPDAATSNNIYLLLDRNHYQAYV